jgi:uncharacterized protein YxjI
MTIDVNADDTFVLRQRVKLVINQYSFAASDEDPPFCFVEQKRFKFKEDIRFYADETKTAELWRILARQRFDPRATYDIAAADGSPIGKIEKVFGSSLLRSTYRLSDAAGNEVCIVRERSLPVALFRRAVGFVPYVGDFADFLPIAYDFEFLRGETRIGINRRRRWKWRDVYDIDFSEDTEHVLDRRLGLAAAVGMDALQAR